MDNNDVHLNVLPSGGVWQKMCYCGKLKYCHMVGKLQSGDCIFFLPTIYSCLQYRFRTKWFIKKFCDFFPFWWDTICERSALTYVVDTFADSFTFTPYFKYTHSILLCKVFIKIQMVVRGWHNKSFWKIFQQANNILLLHFSGCTKCRSIKWVW